MGTETESILKLPLFSARKSTTDYEQMLTPLHTLASIPFKWEEEPGKPRPCTHLIPHPNIYNGSKISLEPPPRLYNNNTECSKTTSSPTTVLDGPYITAKPKFFSFRDHRRQGSFDSCKSSETAGELFSSTFLVSSNKKVESKSWWRRANVKGKAGGGNREISFVFPSTTDYSSLSDDCTSTMKMATLKRRGSFSSISQAKSHIWAAIYEGFKLVMPWKSKKSKKEVLLG